MSSCTEILEGIGRLCQGDHDHQSLEGQVRVGRQRCNRTLIAQADPKAMVVQMLRGFKKSQNMCMEVLASEQLVQVDEKGSWQAHVGVT